MKFEYDKLGSNSNFFLSQRFRKNSIYNILIVLVLLLYLFFYGYWLNKNLNSVEPFYKTFKDIGYWIEASNYLISYQNPYSNLEGFKSGIISALVFGTIQYVPTPFGVNLIWVLIFTFFGLLGFINTFIPSNKSTSGLIFLMLIFSSTREIFINAQITGILLGVFSLFYYTSKLEKNIFINSNYLLKNSIDVLNGFLIIFLIDSKINIFLFPVLLIIVRYKKFKSLGWGFVIWLIIQIYYSIRLNDILILSWYDTLSSVANPQINPDMYGSLGFWQIINKILQSNLILSFGPAITFLILGILSLKFSKTTNINYPLALAFSSNYFYSYFHYYSFFPLLTLFMYFILSYKSPFLFGLVASTMLISFNLTGTNLLISFGVMVVFITIFTFNLLKFDLYFIFGWCTSLGIRFLFLNEISEDDYFTKSMIVFIPLLVLLILFMIRTFVQKIGKFDSLE